MLIAPVSIIGLFADPATTTEKLTEIVLQPGPDTGRHLQAARSKASPPTAVRPGITFVIGLVLAIWAASVTSGPSAGPRTRSSKPVKAGRFWEAASGSGSPWRWC